jgi:hypothetical protein
MDFITILIIVVTFTLILIIAKTVINFQDKKKSKEIFENLTNFNTTDKYISKTSGVSIGYDEKRKQICLIIEHKTKIYEYKDIIQSELDIDGETILKQSITGTIGRSVFGGVLGGGVGAIIGGTTGSKKGKENIRKIDLKITVNDTKTPVYRINFMDIETKKGSFIYEMIYEEAEKWHGIITVLIKQAEIEQDNTKQNSTSSESVADELLKLKNLLDSGIITLTEFNAEKKRLLN